MKGRSTGHSTRVAGSSCPDSPWRLVLSAAVPMLALFAAHPTAFTRFHPPRLAAASLAVLAALALVTWGRERPPGGLWTPGCATLAGVLWLGWCALSLTWSPAPGLGMVQLSLLSVGMIWVLALGAHFRVDANRVLAGKDALAMGGGQDGNREAWPLRGAVLGLLCGFLAAGALLSALALAQRWGALRVGHHQVTATMGNPNHLALALVAILPAGLWLYRWATSIPIVHRSVHGAVPHLVRLSALLWGGLVVAGLLATRCQAAWLALAAAVLAAAALWPHRSLGRRLVFLLATLGAASALALWLIPRQSLLVAVEGRALISRLGLRVVGESPLFGSGLGGFPHRVAWIQGDHLAREAGSYSPLLDAHNQALMMAGEIGLPGLLFALVALILALRPIWAHRRAPEAHAALVVWVALAVFSLSETVFRDVGVWIVALTWLVVGRGPQGLMSSERGGVPAHAGALSRALRRLRERGTWRHLPLGIALLAALVALSDAAADHLHARGLARIGQASGSSDARDFEEALRDYDRALAFSFDAAALHLDRALLLQALGRPRDAEVAARMAFGARPGPDRALLLGDLASAADRTGEAVGWYREAVRLHPRYARARNNLGVALLRAGDRQAGCGSLRRALSLFPFDPTIRGNWRNLCQPLGAPSAPRSLSGTPFGA